MLKTHDLSTAAALLQQSNRFLQNEVKSWKNHIPKQHGAARLFNYMEASDGSEPESEPRTEDQNRVNLTHRIQSDFLEAGGVGSQQDEDNGEEMELPLFVCQTCGCEFEDDLSLETHQFTHQENSTSPVKQEDSKENVDPDLKYQCRLCDTAFDNQCSIMTHMLVHSSLGSKSDMPYLGNCKRSRKQTKPKRITIPFWDYEEVEVLRHLNGKLRKWRDAVMSTGEGISKLKNKYMAQLVTRKRYICHLCKNSTLSRFHTKTSLALHNFWRHAKKKFPCEHCDITFRHRYQCVLHSSRAHSNQKSQIVPMIVHKEFSNHLSICADAVPSTQETSTHFFGNSHTVYVPEAAMTNTHKLGMSFFDHTFIHTTNSINMPIIIPTFPPN